MVIVAGVVALVAVAAGCAAVDDPAAEPSPPPSGLSAGGIEGAVWVANEGGHSLSVIDAATSTVVTTVEGIEGPHNVQVGPAGDRVYAVSGHTGMVAALDASTYRLANAAPAGAGPSHVVLTPDGQKTYVTNYDAGSVSVYRADLAPSGVISVGGGPHGLRPSPDGTTLVVANLKAGTVDLIDARTDTKVAAVPVDGPVVQVAVSPDSRYAFASVSTPPSVVKIDLRARVVAGRTEVPAAPAQVYLTPDGRSLLSADQGSKEKPGTALSVIDTATMTTAGSIATGSGPHGVVIDPTGQRAWVTNVYDATVSVIDLPTRATVATIDVGKQPNGISFATRPPAPGAARMTVVIPTPSAASSGHGEHGGHG
ncbi:beta-propeller fold lactonase family protein [Actinophytocola sp.]|uniref:beta-propeller fold lactonase family protein n=1 Tax=Actinophytocola sp. TaxID=1872138 RepID=UPI002D806259|nr:beta-propeller fold lactonase family protein [Actinophytocola sp.]HET9139697.1 beta-propeller fold lactonase family protein [Actinophytocola sp.]